MDQAIKIAGTGHRPDKLGGYSDVVTNLLFELIQEAVIELNPQTVISGMALGFDQVLAEVSLSLDIPFIAAIPFIGQEKQWPKPSQAHYHALLKHASDVVTVSSGGFSHSAMQIRNQYMVDRCDVVLALWNGSPGGTANCIRYAKNIHKPIVNLWFKWQPSGLQFDKV